MSHIRRFLALAPVIAFSLCAFGATPKVEPKITRDIVYHKASGAEVKLDVHQDAAASSSPKPVLVFMHGGGWARGSKENVEGGMRTYLRMGFTAVNVEYRMTPQATAPAAIEDARCALNWVAAHAKEYGFDPKRIVIAGNSAGGHLALLAGLAPQSAGFQNACEWNEFANVAAIVNFYGIADFAEAIDREKPMKSAQAWMGETSDPKVYARKLTPMTYVGAGSPPVISIHGDADPTVPYDQSVRLHKALEAARIPNQLVTVPGGVHGKFGEDEKHKINASVESFLRARGVLGDLQTATK